MTLDSFLFSPPATPSLAVADEPRRFPVHRVYCVGRNYAAHSREMGGRPEREAPFFFAKPSDSVAQSDTIPYPPQTADLQHEVELVVALGAGGTELGVADVRPLIYGYAVGVDLTRRDLQAEAKRHGRPWTVAKAFDHSAPLSSIIPAQRSGHPQRGCIALAVNGDQRQQGDLGDMIWSVPEVVARLSRYFELQPGDLVFTGTPAGVGPLAVGDVVRAEIEGVTTLEFRVTGR